MLNNICLNMRQHVFSCKLIFRFFAFVSIFYISVSTGIFTYKAGGDLLEFIQFNHIASSVVSKIIFLLISWLSALAIFVQIAPIVWDRLSFWGQQIDNYILYFYTNKKYFIDESEDKLKEIHKQINQTHRHINAIYAGLIYQKIELNQDKIDHLRNNELVQVDKNYQSIINLLKDNIAYDNINRKRLMKIHEDLNIFTNQLTSCYSELLKVQNLLNYFLADEKKGSTKKGIMQVQLDPTDINFSVL